MVGSLPVCELATSGQLAAAPPTRAINSRRLVRPPLGRNLLDYSYHIPAWPFRVQRGGNRDHYAAVGHELPRCLAELAAERHPKPPRRHATDAEGMGPRTASRGGTDVRHVQSPTEIFVRVVIRLATGS
jgi:hypothetical protein